MGRASSGKKVARAAGTGGGRVARGRRPWGWYGVVAGVVVLGLLLVTTSRSDRAERLGAEGSVPPTTDDHWHAAYAFHICGVTFPPLAEDRDPQGIHTHRTETGGGDGVVHIHPFTTQASGKNATLGKFADAAGFTLTDERLKLPGGKTYENGDSCNGKPGKVRVEVDGKEYAGDPRDLRFSKDRMLITIAFAPEGEDLPEPPSKVNLDRLTDVPGQQPPVPLTETPPPSDGESPPPGDGEAPPPSDAPPPSAP